MPLQPDLIHRVAELVSQAQGPDCIRYGFRQIVPLLKNGCGARRVFPVEHGYTIQQNNLVAVGQPKVEVPVFAISHALVEAAE